MSRWIDADALINDLEYDVANDEYILNYVGTIGAERIDTQFDKDCKQNAIDLLLRAPSIETKQIKYFDEEEKVWKIGDVIVEHTERTQEEIPEYEPWRDALDAMDCQSR